MSPKEFIIKHYDSVDAIAFFSYYGFTYGARDTATTLLKDTIRALSQDDA